jgi:hypothetical protein
MVEFNLQLKFMFISTQSLSSWIELIHYVPFICGNLDCEVIIIHEKSTPLYWVDFIHQKFSNLIP